MTYLYTGEWRGPPLVLVVTHVEGNHYLFIYSDGKHELRHFNPDHLLADPLWESLDPICCAVPSAG